MNQLLESLHSELALVRDPLRKVELLHDISRLTFTFDPEAALDYSDQALKIATRKKDQRKIGESLRLAGICRVTLADYRSALDGYERAREIFSRIGDLGGQAATLHSIGFAYVRMGEFGRALEALHDSLRIRRRIGDRPGEGQTINVIGLCYHGLADFARTLDHYLQSLDIYRELDDPTGIAWTHLDIGAVQMELDKLDEAEAHLVASLRFARELNDRRIERSSLLHLGALARKLGRIDESLERLAETLELSRLLGDRSDEASTMMEIARLEVDRGNADVALDYLYPALEIAGQIGALDLRHQLESLAAEALLEAAPARSLAFLTAALAGARSLGNRGLEMSCHRLLSRYYQVTGDHAAALDAYIRHAELRDEILGGEKQRRIMQLELRAQIERAERERERLQAENQRLTQDAEHRAKELTSMALHLVKKNRFLASLRAEMEDTASRFDTKPRLAMRALIRTIDSNLGDEEEWQAFQTQFEQVHEGFLGELSRQYPALTRTELKVCALLKINLSSKEIANILSADVRNIESHRYRIRRKLDLRGDIGFAAFFAEIG